MYNSELTRKTFEQIQQLDTNGPLWQRNKQLKEEIKSLNQQINALEQYDDTSDLQNRLNQAKSMRAETSRQIKDLIRSTTSSVAALQTINPGSKFIPFEQLSRIQIKRYYIDPSLQSLAGNLENKVITIYDANNNTYLVKARYDPSTKRIYPPV